MPLPDNTLPPNPRHDAVAAFNERRPRAQRYHPVLSPIPARRSALIALAIGIAIAPFIFAHNVAYFLVSVVVGFFVSLAALILSIVVWRRNSRTPRDSSLSLPFGRCARLFIVASALFIFNGWSCAQCEGRHRDLDRSIGTMSYLRGIWQAVGQYRDRHDAIPTSLDELVKCDFIYDKQLLLPTDPEGWKLFGTNLFVSSIVYVPEAALPNANPRSILAYERGPWSNMELRLFPTQVHTVVLVDGTVEHLTPAELEAALVGNLLPPISRP